MRRGLPGLHLALAAFAAGAGEPELDTQGHPGIVAAESAWQPRSFQTVCAAGPTLEGIDVSHWDGTVDWAQVAGSGRAWAIAKATEGVTFLDPAFAANWAGMKAAGLVRGAYHFFRPAHGGVEQADWYLSKVGAFAAGDLPP